MNLYVAGTATIDSLGPDGTPVTVTQDTKYPWDGAMKIAVTPRQRRAVRRSSCASRAGRAARPSRAPCIGSSNR